jgi:hypothetical protein
LRSLEKEFVDELERIVTAMNPDAKMSLALDIYNRQIAGSLLEAWKQLSATARNKAGILQSKYSLTMSDFQAGAKQATAMLLKSIDELGY